MPNILTWTNQMRKENVDVVGDKPVKNDAGEMSMSEEATISLLSLSLSLSLNSLSLFPFLPRPHFFISCFWIHLVKHMELR